VPTFKELTSSVPSSKEAKLREANLREADLREADLSVSNLSGANLSGANLVGANLIIAHLYKVNLVGANLSEADLRLTYISGADLSYANLSKVNLSNINLIEDLSNTNFKGTNLSGANLGEIELSTIDLGGVNLIGANLSCSDLSGANLSGANLSGANLSGANLSRTLLIGTNFTEATLTDCNIYGIAAWNVQLDHAVQKNFIITQEHEATITIDNLKVAQFIYLMLNNKEIRDVINTLTTKSVLILGRFTPRRKAVLDALRDALRTHNYLPILFDFEKPSTLDLTETVTTLAHLSRFIIIDFTDPSSSPHEAASIIPFCKVPTQPIFESIGKPYSMSKDFQLYPWVLELYRYRDKDTLITSLKKHIIEPAERKAEELEKLKNS
jgi:uncharacterized protein YjbI with pentapeptide repeats